MTVQALLARSRATGTAVAGQSAVPQPAAGDLPDDSTRAGRRRAERRPDARPAARPPTSPRPPTVPPRTPDLPDLTTTELPVQELPTQERPAQGTAREAARQPPVTSELPAQQVRHLPPRPPAAPGPPPPPAPGVRHSGPVPPLPGTVSGSGVRHSGPVPPLPGTVSGSGVRHSGPVPPLPGIAPASGVRHSRPIPPLPGLGTGVRVAAPLPPIPGLDPAAGEGGSGRAGRRAAMSPLRRRLIRVAVVLAVLAGLAGGYFVGLYYYADRSMDRVAALAPDAPEVLAPQLQVGAQTYLLVGTGLPGESGVSGVSTVVARLSPGADRAVLVSLPPTALVDQPECRDAGGDLRAPVTGPLADALLAGGPACLVRAVQQLSGVRIDHYVAVDLARLPGMVDALGGVRVCLPAALADGVAGLTLPAGTSDVDGDQVTGLLSPGTGGSDVTGAGVAERGQRILTTTMAAALSTDMLRHPLTAATVLTRAAGALTVDDGTTLGDIRALSATLGELPRGAVQRASLPVSGVGYVPAGSMTAQVVLDSEATRALFDSVIARSALPEPAADPSADPATATTTTTGSTQDPAATDPVAPAGPITEPGTVTVAPADVTVDVLDATGAGDTSDVGGTVAAGLTAQGFRTGVVGVEPGAAGQTVIRYGPLALDRARTVAAAVPGAVLQPSSVVGDAVQLVVAADQVAVQPVEVGSAVPASAVPVQAPTGAGPASCR